MDNSEFSSLTGETTLLSCLISLLRGVPVLRFLGGMSIGFYLKSAPQPVPAKLQLNSGSLKFQNLATFLF